MAEALEIDTLNAWYGESQVLHGMSFTVRKGEIVTLLGRNGAGKTTTLKAIMGLIAKRSGSILVEGSEIVDKPAYAIAHKGIALCPEERGIFSSLTVIENLLLPPKIKPGGMEIADILKLFPNLRERFSSQGTKLSGGEQQMLALGRILHTGAHILLLDEPTEGLAPVVIQQIGRTIETLKSLGYTIVLVEQNVHFAAGLADRHYVVELGRVVEEIPGAELQRKLGSLQSYLGL